MKLFIKGLLGLFLCFMMFNSDVSATERIGTYSELSDDIPAYTVIPYDAIMYANEYTLAYDYPYIDMANSCQSNWSFSAGSPVHVIGITSNGYWKISFKADNDTIYCYLSANGLSAKSDIVPVPVKDSSGKYVCVIEEGDIELFRNKTVNNWNEKVAGRTDYTTNPYYIYYRDQLEAAWLNNDYCFNARGFFQCEELAEILRNLCVDFIKSHPEIASMQIGAICPTASYSNPFDGTEPADYFTSYFSYITNEKSPYN